MKKGQNNKQFSGRQPKRLPYKILSRKLATTSPSCGGRDARATSSRRLSSLLRPASRNAGRQFANPTRRRAPLQRFNSESFREQAITTRSHFPRYFSRECGLYMTERLELTSPWHAGASAKAAKRGFKKRRKQQEEIMTNSNSYSRKSGRGRHLAMKADAKTCPVANCAASQVFRMAVVNT